MKGKKTISPTRGSRPLATKKSCGGITKRAKMEARELVVVFDKEAKSQVERKQKLRKVDCTSWDFDATRRNKKIQKVMEIQKQMRESKDSGIQMQVVTSKKGSLSELECIYNKSVIEVLQKPKDFTFHKLDWKHQDFFNITKPNSKSVIMQYDGTPDEMQVEIPGLECDIGVLKRSVEELLAKKTNDVIAVNTHPGHHAAPKKATNYCTINNIAFAARQLKKVDPRIKIGVIDIDIHPGDGTQAFVMHYPRLVKRFVSIHSTWSFWMSRMNMDAKGHRFGFGANGIALKKDKQGQVGAERVIRTIQKVVDKWDKDRLDVIIVSLGFDTLKCDPLAGSDLGWQMQPADFYRVGQTFAQRPEQFFFIQEGGYEVTATATAFGHLIKGFTDGRKRLEE